MHVTVAISCTLIGLYIGMLHKYTVAPTEATTTAAGVTSTASTDAQPSTMMATDAQPSTMMATDTGATSAGQSGGATDMQGGDTSTVAEPAQTVPRSSACMKQSGSH